MAIILLVKLNSTYWHQIMTTGAFALCAIRLVKLTLGHCSPMPAVEKEASKLKFFNILNMKLQICIDTLTEKKLSQFDEKIESKDRESLIFFRRIRLYQKKTFAKNFIWPLSVLFSRTLVSGNVLKRGHSNNM